MVVGKAIAMPGVSALAGGPMSYDFIVYAKRGQLPRPQDFARALVDAKLGTIHDGNVLAWDGFVPLHREAKITGFEATVAGITEEEVSAYRDGLTRDGEEEDDYLRLLTNHDTRITLSVKTENELAVARGVAITLARMSNGVFCDPQTGEEVYMTELSTLEHQGSQLRKVGFWREHGGRETSPSLTQARGRGRWPAATKAALIQYLDAGNPILVVPGPEPDFFDPDELAGTPSVLTDGKYAWPQHLAYYVEKYDVELPNEFVDHAESSGWKVPG